MARKKHYSVSTSDAHSLPVSDPTIAGSAAETAPAPLERAGAPHIAPQLRALVVPIDCVELHPRNPRRGDVAAVAASLTRFGLQKPVVVQKSTGYRGNLSRAEADGEGSPRARLRSTPPRRRDDDKGIVSWTPLILGRTLVRMALCRATRAPERE